MTPVASAAGMQILMLLSEWACLSRFGGGDLYLYAEYIMRNAGLEEAQAGIKIAGRNINNLRHADDTTLMAKREEELKRLLMRAKEKNEKADLTLNIQKTEIMACGHITSWQIDGETMETVTNWGLHNHCRWWLQP